jgi:glutaminase
MQEWTGGLNNMRDFYLLDTAIEWAEDQLIYRYGGAIDFHETTELVRTTAARGSLGRGADRPRLHRDDQRLRTGEKIVSAGDPATSLFFLRSGAVHVTLPDGVRLATLTAGMAFGEMALIEPQRSANVLADARRPRSR